MTIHTVDRQSCTPFAYARADPTRSRGAHMYKNFWRLPRVLWMRQQNAVIGLQDRLGDGSRLLQVSVLDPHKVNLLLVQCHA